MIRRTVEKTIREFAMVRKGDAILAGVSGGSDSVALLNILTELAPDFSLKIGVAHLNHQLRGENSDNDAAFVSRLAEKFGMACHMGSENVEKHRRTGKMCLEEAARTVRYAFLREIAKKHGFEKIAVGHNADDNAELVLINLIRGSGPLGISGIPPTRDGIIRPLIRVPKSEIIRYLESKNADFVTDESNTDETILRNRIRQSLIPVLRSYNPKISESLNRLSIIMRYQEDWIDGVANELFEKCLLTEDEEGVSLSVCRIAELPEGARRRVVMKGIERVRGDLRKITGRHIKAVTGLSENGHLDLPDSLSVTRNGNRLCFLKTKNRPRRNPKSDFEHKIVGPGVFFIKEIGLSLKFSIEPIDEFPILKNGDHHVEYFDPDSLRFPLTIRNFRPGDRFRPLGMKGTQKLKHFFINNKIPRSDRSLRPVLTCGNTVVCVVGYRISDDHKLTPLSANALKMEL